MINRSRRHALSQLCAGAGAALLFRRSHADRAPAASKQASPHRDPPGDGKFLRALRIPGHEGVLAQMRLTQPIDLVAGVDVLPVFSGLATKAWTYSATLAGKRMINPLLIARHGDLLDVTLDNRLGQDTTIHWHGLAVDEANDGSGLHPVRHGERYRYSLRVRNRAALYWYHAHPHFHTGEQVHQGLAGLLLVEDDEELALRAQLDLGWGERDIPLLIADKQLARKNELAYKPGADDWIGNRVLVNWVPEPYLDVQRGLYRLRMANVSNARMFRPAFMLHGKPLPFHLIGTDGGLLEKPWLMHDCFLAPAQRLDVLLDLGDVEAGARVVMQSLAYDPMENDATAAGEDPMHEHPGAAAMGAVMDLMELRVGDSRATRTRIPQRLSSSLPVVPTKTDTTRKFRIRIADSGRWMINDWNFLLNGHAPGFEVRRGAREIWEFDNEFRSMPHPIHLHGFQFRVVDRSNSPPQIRARSIASGGRGPHDLGLLDTVVVWPGERVRIALDFSQPFTGAQTYMFHCHNLEHEDQGMMVAFVVRDAAATERAAEGGPAPHVGCHEASTRAHSR